MPTEVTIQNLYIFNSALSKTEEDVSLLEYRLHIETFLCYHLSAVYELTVLQCICLKQSLLVISYTINNTIQYQYTALVKI